jgi:hypothetical protein
MKPPLLLFCILSIKSGCTWLALNIFTKLTVVSDPYSYVAGNFGNDLTAGRTQFVGILANVLANLTNETMPHYIFSWSSGIAIWLFLLQIPRTFGRFLMPLFFLPSVAMWTSLVSKESLAATGVCLILSGWVRIIRSRGHFLVTSLLLISGFLLYGYLRPHFALGAAALVFLTTLLHPSLSASPKGRYFRNPLQRFSTGMLILAIFLLTLAGYKKFFAGLDDIISQSLVYFRHDIGGSSRNAWLSWRTNSDFYENAWWALPFSVIGPLPTEALEKLKFMSALMEGLFIFFLPILAFLLFIRRVRRSPDAYTRYLYQLFFIGLPLVTAYLYAVHAPHGTMNAGSAVRYRAGFEYLLTVTWTFMGLQILKSHRDAKVQPSGASP